MKRGDARELEGAIVLGVPRSGTTLLRRLLDSHASVSCPSETNVFTACGRFLRQEYIAEGVPVGVLSGLAFAGIPEEETLGLLRELAFQFFRDIARKQGKSVWVSKTPDDVFYVDEIEKLCGSRTRFVYLIRHGLDVACSLQDLCQTNGVYLTEVYQYIRRFPAPLTAFSHLWADVTRRINRFVADHSDNSLCVRYEDLVSQPRRTMSEVFQFLQVEATDWDLDGALANKDHVGLGDWKAYERQHVDTSSVGRWRRLSKHTASQLAPIVNPVLTQCGYEVVEDAAPRSASEAQRRYELGLLLKSAAAAVN